MGGGYCNWLDVAKGIGILLVIIGHCIFPFHILIDVFHMPLFFLIAGITFHKKTDVSFLIGKVNRIGVPYCFWIIVSSIAALVPHPYTGIFNGPLWFLQTIFVALIIMQLVSRLNYKLSLQFSCVLFLLSFIFLKYGWSFLPFYLPRCIIAYIYIFIGYKLAARIRYDYKLYKLIYLCIVCLCLFALTLGYLLKFYNLSGAFFNLSIYSNNFILTFICSLFGIFFTICVAKLIMNNKCLSWLGKNSLVIMCVHFPFAQILNVYISSLPHYTSMGFRCVAAICEYFIVIGISAIFVILCKQYLPRLTGYKSFITS